MKIVIAQFKDFEREIRFVRETVFVLEQGVPRELEIDSTESICEHVIVFEDQKPIAVGRINLGEGKIGRVAVLKEYRKQGAGRLVIEAIEKIARQNELTKLWFHAQVTSIPFYRKLGYETVGEEFLEADIVHMKMEKEFS